MDLSKVAKEMMDFQTRLVVFEKRSNETKDLLTRLLKENLKLEKKLEKETDEIEILYMKLRIEYNKKMIHQIEDIYKNSVETSDKKENQENEK